MYGEIYMKKVTIDPGCISCGSCAYFAPEVFEVTDISRVKNDADLKRFKECIQVAAEKCPMQIIKYEE